MFIQFLCTVWFSISICSQESGEGAAFNMTDLLAQTTKISQTPSFPLTTGTNVLLALHQFTPISQPATENTSTSTTNKVVRFAPYATIIREARRVLSQKRFKQLEEVSKNVTK